MYFVLYLWWHEWLGDARMKYWKVMLKKTFVDKNSGLGEAVV